MVNVFVFMRGFLWCCGITWIKRTKLRIKDVIGDYKPVQDTSVAPIVVSNHTSMLDNFYFLAKNVSFLSKDAVARTPYIGMHAIARQSLFLDRASSEDRNKIAELIKIRAERVIQKGDISPLLIFPEGSVTNGRHLMSFKRGAFMTSFPIKIYVLKYNPDSSEVVWSISNIDALSAFIIGLSQLTNTIEEIEFEDNFDPKWVYNKYNLKQDDENAWQYVAREVKNLMAFASGFKQVDQGMRDTDQFKATCKAYNSQLLASQ